MFMVERAAIAACAASSWRSPKSKSQRADGVLMWSKGRGAAFTIFARLLALLLVADISTGQLLGSIGSLRNARW